MMPDYIYQPYPKVLYPVDGSAPVTVTDATEHAALGDGYRETPEAPSDAATTPDETPETPDETPATRTKRKKTPTV